MKHFPCCVKRSFVIILNWILTIYSASYVLLIGGNYKSMESWTPYDFTPPTYNALPPNNQRGSVAARHGGRLYSCGGESDRKKCYTTLPGIRLSVPQNGIFSYLFEFTHFYYFLKLVYTPFIISLIWSKNNFLSL